MPEENIYYDALGRWAEVSNGRTAQLVRITELEAGNRYHARPVAFDASGGTELIGTSVLTVVNLAEPANEDGQVPTGTDAVAIDVGGRWVVFLRRAATVGFLAKVTASQGGAAYTVRQQIATGAGTFADAPGATDLTAHNLAELSLGPGAAVGVGTIVPLTVVPDNGNPPIARYLFDHPAYAKYLD